MLFCPVCGNLLISTKRLPNTFTEPKLRFECRTCTYIHSVTTRIERNVCNLPKKQVDDILGGDSAWKGADSTKATCPKCEHEGAYFFQMQTRSADEPMTTFYRCQECEHQWKEN